MFNRVLHWLFFAIIVRPLIWVVLGLNIRHYERFPQQGPMIIVANHNSHLDTLVLMSLFPLSCLPKVRPVAAADYFLRNSWIAWFALNIIGIIPIMRKKTADVDPFTMVYQALAQEDIVILFPEGTRGEPEQMSQFKSGIAYLAKNCPQVSVIPIFFHGLGKALPRGEMLFVPFFCDVFIGEPLQWQGDKENYMKELDLAMHRLANEGHFSAWE
jgi:1-acyl-sn-glycerol-3-phosphate acyltransferase